MAPIWLDWVIIAAFFAGILLVSVPVSKRAGSSSAEYFLGGRSMPWWLLGVSMAATTFSTDIPNLIMDRFLSRNEGGKIPTRPDKPQTRTRHFWEQMRMKKASRK